MQKYKFMTDTIKNNELLYFQYFFGLIGNNFDVFF